MGGFQTIFVNGTAHTAISAGGGTRGCHFSQSGAWGATVTLNPGSNDVEAEVCDDSDNCGFGSTTIIYDAPPSYSLSVSAATPTMTVQTSSSGSASFTVTNNGGTPGTLTISIACSVVTACNTADGMNFSKPANLGGQIGVTVTFNTPSSAGTGTVSVSASYVEAPTVSGSASTTVTIQAPPPPPPA
ncbi:MAG TPA: hypothetical protein VGI97_09525, partial [Gemmatimonadaceae bacterium]